MADRDLAVLLAEHVARTRYEDLPPEAVHASKLFLLDAIGCAIAGSTAPAVGDIVAQAADWGGKPEATVLVDGLRLPAPMAAFINGMMLHARDFDDTHTRTPVHATASVVPAALAAAEVRGGVSGKELITAIALGVDIASRLGLCLTVRDSRTGKLNEDRGFHLSTTGGGFGSAAIAGRLLGMDAGGIANCLGTVYTQIAGNLQPVIDGALTKRIQPALAARAALFSAFLVRRGIDGATRPFQGIYGYFPLYHNDVYDPNQITDELGKRFEVSNLGLKRYPCCRLNHSSLDALLALLVEHDLKPDDIERVVTHVSAPTIEVVCNPFSLRRTFQVDAQFNLAYSLAVAIRRREVVLEDFDADRVADPETHAMMQRIKSVHDPVMDPDRWPCRLEVHTRSGQVLTRSVAHLRGTPENPSPDDEFVSKFHACVRMSKKPLPGAERFVEAALSLEKAVNIDSILSTLVGI